jgi:arylsulfatase A-like enzyme
MLERTGIKEEMEVLNDYVDKLGTDFVGSLVYTLSIRYVDFCIEEFCSKLKELGLWKNTTLLFVADHGASYSYYPLHGNRTVNLDDECFHIPMMIRSFGLKGQSISKYANSKDVFPTLFDIVGIEKPSCFTGASIIDNKFPDKKYVMSEFIPGCPDLLSREIWLCIRDKSYIIGYKVGVYQNFKDGKVCYMYNLTKDPYGFYNIAYKNNFKEVEYLIKSLEERFNEIKLNANIFLQNLRK